MNLPKLKEVFILGCPDGSELPVAVFTVGNNTVFSPAYATNEQAEYFKTFINTVDKDFKFNEHADSERHSVKRV